MALDRRSFHLGWRQAKAEMRVELAQARAEIEAELASLRHELRALQHEHARAVAIDAALAVVPDQRVVH
jgi:hypothetical protein